MMGNTVQYFHLPLRAYLAGETFAAAFMGKETAQAVEDFTQIYRLIVNLDHTGAQGDTIGSGIFIS